MSEKAIFYARAVVYYYDSATKNWAPTAVGNDFCNVAMYENSANNTYRVIGRGVADPTKIVINSTITKDIQYSRASETFGKWTDPRYIYGLNFASLQEAQTFGTGFETVVKKLSGSPAVATPAPQVPTPQQAPKPQAPQAPTPQQAPKPPAPQPTPPQAPVPQQAPKPPSAPAPPSAPSAPAPPAPPSAPAPPAPPSAPAPPAPGAPSSLPPKATGSRADLLSSITGFSKNGLKKAETVDKSSPLLDAKGSSSSGGSSSGSSARPSPVSGGGDMMSAILAKRNNMMKNPSPGTSNAPAPKPHNPAPSQPVAPKPNPVVPNPNANRPGTFKQPNPQSVAPKPNPVAPAQTNTGGNSGGFTQEDLDALKQEILNEVRAELQILKSEILSALQQS